MHITQDELESLKWVVETHKTLTERDDRKIMYVYQSIVQYLKYQRKERGNMVHGVLLYNVLNGSTVDEKDIQLFDFDESLPTIKFLDKLRDEYLTQENTKG